ncbi:hypothetical protein ABH927_006485, partial [Planotetraspora sp. GP83]
RTGRHPRQPLRDSLPFDNHTVKLPTTTDKNAGSGWCGKKKTRERMAI